MTTMSSLLASHLLYFNCSSASSFAFCLEIHFCLRPLPLFFFSSSVVLGRFLFVCFLCHKCSLPFCVLISLRETTAGITSMLWDDSEAVEI